MNTRSEAHSWNLLRRRVSRVGELNTDRAAAFMRPDIKVCKVSAISPLANPCPIKLSFIIEYAEHLNKNRILKLHYSPGCINTHVNRQSFQNYRLLVLNFDK